MKSFGIVYLEANLHGKPVIAASVGGVPDAVVDGVSGFLIEENNITILKEKILLLMNNKKLRDQLERQAKTKSRVTFFFGTNILILLLK